MSALFLLNIFLKKGIILKYFIDFEATQYKEDIISIGCVDENGRKFYTTAKPHKLKHVTKLITEITGLTKEELEDAPSQDEAFSMFYEWIDKTQPCKFYCYGSSDKIFIERTRSAIESFEAQVAMGLVYTNLIDYTEHLKKRYSIDNEVALIKVYNHYTKENTTQSHNALEDAILLKTVYSKTHDNNREEAFVEYRDKPIKKVNTNKIAEKTTKESTVQEQQKPKPKPKKKKPRYYSCPICAKRNDEIYYFCSYKDAAEWCKIQQYNPSDTPLIAKRIKKALKKDDKYMGFNWISSTGHKAKYEDVAYFPVSEDTDFIDDLALVQGIRPDLM